MKWGAAATVIFGLLLSCGTACRPRGDAPVVFDKNGHVVDYLHTAPPELIAAKSRMTGILDEVKASPNGDVWVKNYLAERGGNAMFPKWSIQPLSADIVEVTASYMHLQDNGSSSEIYFSWQVSASNVVVEAPRVEVFSTY